MIVNMRVVCPQDLKNTQRNHAKTVAGKRWEKHERVELKDGVWVEPLKVLSKRKTVDSQACQQAKVRAGTGTRKEIHKAKVGRNGIVEGRPSGRKIEEQMKVFRFGTVDALDEGEGLVVRRWLVKEEGTDKHRFFHCLLWKKKME